MPLQIMFNFLFLYNYISQVHKDWMSKFEKEASSHLQTLSKPQPDSVSS